MTSVAVADLRERIAVQHRRDLPFTDVGNSERLVADHGGEIRYVPAVGWHVWDGRRWRRDGDGEVMRRMKITTRTMRDEAAQLGQEGDDLWKHANRSESRPRLEAALALAQTDSAVIAHVDALDADPYLLNVENGTINLRTGVLQPHQPSDLLTKLASVHYDPDATSPRWAGVLHDATGGDEDLLAFLARAFGYTLTGDTGEEVLFFPHGPAATGKSTVLEALKATLGDYAATADFETFLARKGEAGTRSDIARLAGARLVIGTEVDDGKRLAEGLLKQVTGGDTVTARFMYQDYFEYRPQFKLWLAANHRPRVNAQDEAMWRRIIQIPFTHVVPPERRDPGLKRELTTDASARSAILTWAVRGCLAWQTHGLAVPAAVRDYTDEYRAENDPIAEWLTDHCRLDDDASTAAGDLRASYEQWAATNGDKTVGSKTFAETLRGHGCTNSRGAQGKRQWHGIALQVTPSDVTYRKPPS